MIKHSSKSERLLSLDALRGFDMFWITGGEGLIFSLSALTGWPVFTWAEKQMQHVSWDGFAFYDMIFPLFLFIAGVSMPFSIAKRKKMGENSKKVYVHLFTRLILLILLGFIYNGILNFDFEHQRYASVLGRIGLAWFFAALVVLNASRRFQIVWCAGILIVYWALMKLVPVPGYGAGILTPEGNLGAYIDQKLLPGSFCCYTYGDNEGLLSTLPAISTALLGALTGHFLISGFKKISPLNKGLIMLGTGVVFLLLGKLWGTVFPIIKNLWTSSFVLYAAGWSLILLAVFFIIIDVWKLKAWSFPFVVIGLNSITAYMLTAGIMNFQSMNEYIFTGITNLFAKPVQPVISSIGFIICVWAVLYLLYRKKIFLKV